MEIIKRFPSLTITEKIASLVSEISLDVGSLGTENKPLLSLSLRKANRVRSIHSSLAIEANTLSVDEVAAILGGKKVVGPEREVREAVNAGRAYDNIAGKSVASVDDFLCSHYDMTERHPGLDAFLAVLPVLSGGLVCFGSAPVGVALTGRGGSL